MKHSAPNPYLAHFRRHRRLLAGCWYALLSSLAAWAASTLVWNIRPDGLVVSISILVFCRVLFLRTLRADSSSWRHFGLIELWTSVRACAAALAAAGILSVLWLSGGREPRIPAVELASFLLADAIVFCGALLAGHSLVRMLCEARAGSGRAVLLYGAGEAGASFARELLRNPGLGLTPVGFLDDDPQKLGLSVAGLRVLGGAASLPSAVPANVEEVLITMPGQPAAIRARTLARCRQAGLSCRGIPGWEWMLQRATNHNRDFTLEDLVDRASEPLLTSRGLSSLAGKRVLVTGAGGSIGSEICRTVARARPALLIAFDQAESNLFRLSEELRNRHPDLPFRCELGSLLSENRLREMFRRQRPEVVYHAAAYKHVPVLEEHPVEAVETNILGSWFLSQAAVQSGASTFVLISTDKAVNPSNCMGAAKRVAELLCPAAGGWTRFATVRFGNVLGSCGSVLPLFLQQIKWGGPITVTHPDMERYFMSIPEAAELVIEASALTADHELFVLDMGPPARILDLAKRLSRLHNLEPGEDIEIKFTGLRAGEKLNEQLYYEYEQPAPTEHPRIRTVSYRPWSSGQAAKHVLELRRALRDRDASRLIDLLREAVPEFQPGAELLVRVRDSEGVPVA
ncbi:MAG: polysaccharide biosynthesis protein [Bryobacteraceae bacterium]|nr:polysaccharide biosynthesis protein [Bryobacteraceae bacterium]